jgi:hypothetical protein
VPTLEPGKPALFTGPAPGCTVEHTPHRNSLCVVVAIEEERQAQQGYNVLCRAQDGTVGYARPDELRPIDEGDTELREREEAPATAMA